MRKLEEFYGLKLDAEDDANNLQYMYTKKAVTAVGLQAGERKIWVLNGKVHLDEDGHPINPQQSPYVWLADFVPSATLNSHSFPDNTTCSTVQPHKRSRRGVRKLIDALQEVYGTNFHAALLLLGAGVLALHYESIYDQGGKVPAAIACGDVSLGKSSATEAALSLLGVHETNKVKSATDIQVLKSATKTTLGFIIDDPTKAAEIAEKLLYNFEKGARVTRNSKDAPRTTFLTSMNSRCLQKLADMDARYK